MTSAARSGPPTDPFRRIGALRLTPAGFGLVKLGDEDAFIAATALGPALDGDEVEVEVIERRPKGPRARVVRITARKPRRLCGFVDVDGRFVADDARFHRSLRCDAGGGLARSPLALCGGELLPANLDDGAELIIVRVFGSRGEPRAEEDAILWREELADIFPEAVLQEADATARSAGSSDASERVDLRELAFVTIDPASAEDHDDAICAWQLEQGRTQIHVAIADVSAFVAEGGPLDLEARRRGASLYFPGRVIPMLPQVLSSGVASLLPDVDRCAMVLELQLDENQQVLGRRLMRASIRSRARLTYEDAAEVLRSNGKGGSIAARAQAETILLLDRVSQKLRAARTARGAVIIDAHEVVVETNSGSGMPLRITRPIHDADESRAHQLVEELMLLANETVGDMLRQQGTSILFRSHEPPSELRALGVVEAARRAGVDIDDEVALDTTQLRDLIKELPDAPVRAQLSALLLEAMPTALYAAGREDHFALASSHYVHFTSPIRRYADLTIHRAIEAMLLGRPPNAAVDPEVVNLSQRRARALQREVAELYAALLMQSHLGKEYEGTLAHVGKRQCFVSLDAPAVNVRCPRPSGELEVGMRVNARIENVTIATRVIEATIVGGTARGPARD